MSDAFACESVLFHFPSPRATVSCGYSFMTAAKPFEHACVNMSASSPMISMTTPSGTFPPFRALIPSMKARAAFALDFSRSNERKKSTLPPSGDVSSAATGIFASLSRLIPGTSDRRSTAPPRMKASIFCVRNVSMISMIFIVSAWPSRTRSSMPSSFAFVSAPLTNAWI